MVSFRKGPSPDPTVRPPPSPSKSQHQFPTAELFSGFRAAKSIRSYLLRLELEALGLGLGPPTFPFLNTPGGGGVA